ncbi:MAG TPA: ABC transporter permease [Verrucomicrobiae bacterium]|jgi:phospholipid/cholesterol/gamma-HCH transport system permease protein|nr:ABC transporter permease [Verrucomicrobiae bacterium]
MPPNDTTNLPVHWDFVTRPGGAAALVLRGELDAATTPAAWNALEQELRGKKFSELEIDASQLTDCDSAGLALLYCLSVDALAGVTVRVTGLGPELQHLFRSFSKQDYDALQAHDPVRPSFVEDVGAATSTWLRDLRQQVEFIGEVAADVLASIFRPRRMRWREVFRVFETAGVNALPIVSLLTFLVGMVIAFEAAQPLAQLGAQVFVANLLGLTMTRELGPVMAAIMLAGRSGSAFAAELGTMKVNEELNALQTMGLSPVQFLIVQRVVAGLLLTPVLTIYAMYAGLLGGIPVLLGLGFPLRMVLRQVQSGLHFGDLAEGLSKSIVFGGIVASVSCLRGLQTGEGPRAVGESTTRSVVSSILLIILADALFAAITYTLRK